MVDETEAERSRYDPRPEDEPRVTRKVGRPGRLLLTCILVSLPAWAFYLYTFSYPSEFDGPSLEARTRVFEIAATILVAGFSLAPTWQSIESQRGRGPNRWSPLEAATVAATGSIAILTILQNAERAAEGLEMPLAAGMAVTAAAGIYGFTRVVSSPSPTGIARRASAKAVIDTAKLDDADEDATKVLAARAELGRQDIAEGFRRYGDANETSARWFLIVGVIVFLGSVGTAAWLVAQLGERAGVAPILTRAAITLPGAIVFGVLVREASSRRRYAAWGGLIAIQAEHLGAFTSDMESEEKVELEMQFARSVFRGGDVALDQVNQPISILAKQGSLRREQPQSSASLAIEPSELLDLVASAIGLVRTVQQTFEAPRPIRNPPAGPEQD